MNHKLRKGLIGLACGTVIALASFSLLDRYLGPGSPSYIANQIIPKEGDADIYRQNGVTIRIKTERTTELRVETDGKVAHFKAIDCTGKPVESIKRKIFGPQLKFLEVYSAGEVSREENPYWDPRRSGSTGRGIDEEKFQSEFEDWLGKIYSLRIRGYIPERRDADDWTKTQKELIEESNREQERRLKRPEQEKAKRTLEDELKNRGIRK